MLSKNQSILYFLLGCIPIRLLIVAIAFYINKQYLPYLGIALLFPALGFLGLYFLNIRMNAYEAGGKTWWAEFRLIHGLLFLCASIYAFQSKSITWIPLLLDVIIGFVLFINQHKQEIGIIFNK